MIDALWIGIGVLAVVVPCSFLGGWVFAHRRLPRTLARMSETELANLAAQTVTHKHFEAESLPSLDERNAAALDAAYEKHAQMREFNG